MSGFFWGHCDDGVCVVSGIAAVICPVVCPAAIVVDSDVVVIVDIFGAVTMKVHVCAWNCWICDSHTVLAV